MASLAISSVVWFVGVVGPALTLLPDRWTGHAVGWGIVAVFVGLLPAGFAARIPHEVTVYEGGMCAFRSLIRIWIVRAHQILSISVDTDGAVTIVYDGGRIGMYRLKDFDAFVAQLLEYNPAISLRHGWRAELRSSVRARRRDGK
jgi:hypothetical protein